MYRSWPTVVDSRQREGEISAVATFRTLLCLLGVIVAVGTTGVYAQDAEFPDDSQIEYVFDEVTVTGSRIKTEAGQSTAPVVILSRAEIKAKGLASVGDILQSLTVQSNATNTQANYSGDGATRISLRGLGAQRTLVLVNGRRFVPGGLGADASVDLNSLPSTVIERIEVLKDGASAVYGSDAVGGVVNVITRTDLDGIEVESYQGISGDGDGGAIDLAFTTGIRSARGNILFSAGYHDQRPVWTFERSFSESDKNYNWAKNDGSFTTSGSSATPEGHIVDQSTRAGNAAWQAVNAAAGDGAGDYHLDPAVGWRPFSYAGNSLDGTGDLYNYQPENYIYTPQTRYTAFLSGDYALSDRLRTYFEVSYANRQSEQKLAPTPLFTIDEGITVSAGNRYNGFGRDFTDVRRRFVEAGNRIFNQDIDTYRIVLGLKIPVLDFDSDLFFAYGRTSGNTVNRGRFIRSRLMRALGPDGDCSGDCVPLDILHGAGTITPEMLDYIQYTGVARGYSQQKILQWNLTGQVAELAHGPLAVAAGVSSRWESGAYTPDPITASGNTTGFRSEATEGSYAVSALYGETRLPVYHGNRVGIHLTAAGRSFHYDTFGSGFTYETGASVELPRGLVLRATYSNAFRAPNIAEMFLGANDVFPLVSDPCSTIDEGGNPRELTAQQAQHCAAAGIPAGFRDSRAQLRAREGGSTDLDPEKAAMITGGLSYRPDFAENLNVNLNYYRNRIEDEIGALPAGVILSNCYSQDAPSHCEQIVRDADTRLISHIIQTNTNVGETETAGLDLEVDYNGSTPAGILSARLESNMLIRYAQFLPTGGGTEVIKGRGYYDVGVFPRWRHAASLDLKWRRASAGLTWEYVGGFVECEDNDCKGLYRSDVAEQPAYRDVESNSVLGLRGTYRLFSRAGGTVLSLGVNNVFNQPPAVIFNGLLGTSDFTAYDFMGRYLYLRLSHFI